MIVFALGGVCDEEGVGEEMRWMEQSQQWLNSQWEQDRATTNANKEEAVTGLDGGGAGDPVAIPNDAGTRRVGGKKKPAAVGEGVKEGQSGCAKCAEEMGCTQLVATCTAAVTAALLQASSLQVCGV